MKTLKEQEEEFEEVRSNMLYRRSLRINNTINNYVLIKDNIVQNSKTIMNTVISKKNKPRNNYPTHWNNKLRKKYISYYGKCIRKKKEFTLSYTEFELLLSNPCVYCTNTNNITIDRIDSSLGYIYSNCESCCNVCNTMKLEMSKEEFLNHIKLIHKHI